MTETAPAIRYPIDSRAERILTAALSEFTRRGVRAARMSVIARRAGVSLATLRQYFPTRDELFREMIRSTIVRLIQNPPEPAPATPGQSVTERLQRFMRQFWRAMAEPDQAALLRLSLGELSSFPELAVFHTTEVSGRAASRLEALLSEGVRRGDIRLLDVRTAARVVLSALLTHAQWFASPEIYGDLIGPDRERTEQGVIDFLVGALSGASA
jgi:TetR/AcrR family transcriptional regulator